MNPTATPDTTRVAFLLALDKANFEVSAWEAEFLESFLKRPDCRTARFSERQRAAVDRMMVNYLPRLEPLTAKVEGRKAESRNGDDRIARCAAGGCQYLTREDGKLRECGARATHRLNKANGLLYCAECARTVQIALLRSGSKLEVRPL